MRRGNLWMIEVQATPMQVTEQADGRDGGASRPLRPGRPEAAAAIWAWRVRAAAAAAPDAAGALRLRGLLQGAAAGILGTGVMLFWSKTVGTLIIAFGTVILIAALLSPNGAYALLTRLFAATGNVVGRALSWVLLTPLFYLFFLPFGLLLRRGRRDRLKRFFEREAESYWEDHLGITAGSGSIERQF